jgi:WD repeat-containing protein 45
MPTVRVVLGLLSLATGAYATLLAIPGKQLGHVHLVHLPPCPPPTPLGPPSAPPPGPPPPLRGDPVPIIAAHTSALNTLTSTASGRLLATTSERGTLVRVWDAHTGKLLRELRRGSDKAVIYGVAFRPDEAELCVWSDKGTVHVFALASGPGPSCVFPFLPLLLIGRTCQLMDDDDDACRNRQSTFSPLTPFLPLPKYFDSEWSYAQYRIPSQAAHISLHAPGPRPSTEDEVDEERCAVGWIEAPREEGQPGEFQLIVLTYSGGWYRLSLPSSGSSAQGAFSPRHPISPSSSSPPSIKSFAAKQRARSSSGSSARGRDKGKEREHDKEGRDCTLQEFRRFGRWDGWG